jgi:hypothetical protein
MTGSLIVAALLVVAVRYAHAEIPRFTKGTTHRTLAHVVLIVVGVCLWRRELVDTRSAVAQMAGVHCRIWRCACARSSDLVH